MKMLRKHTKMKRFTAALFVVLFAAGLGCVSCESDDAVVDEPMLIVKFKFDENQARLNNLGMPSSVLPGNAAQSPNFNSISAHYLELAPTATTQLGDGIILYHAPETNMGGQNAIDFGKSKKMVGIDPFIKLKGIIMAT